MPQAANSGDLVLSGKYEIAEPIAYPIFAGPGTAGAPSSRESLAPLQPGPYREPWDDSGKERHYEKLNGGGASENEVQRRGETKAAARETRAIWIVHGMGQQIPFETVDSLAQGLLAFGAVLFLAEMSKPGNLRRGLRLTISILSWIALIVTIFSVMSTALLMLLTTQFAWGVALLNNLPRARLQAFATLVIFASAALVGVAMIWRAALRSAGEPLRGNWFMSLLFALSFALNLASIGGAVWIWRSRAQALSFQMPGALAFLYNSIWVWPFLILLSAKIREVMVQYVGDVAIYVTPNKLDRFDDVRNKIKDTARAVASAVYMACKPGTNDFLYQQIALVGHSLGSVITYDTLNRLMLDDWLSKNHLGVANRTNCMVTFGSPLNKTAFFFTIQGSDTLHIRERLAATVQPLIQSYAKFRKFKWINVFSRNDIISGALEFYDLPSVLHQVPLPDVAVHNVVDKDAAVPLVAHVNYWHNETVWKQLLSEIAP
jgi:hypothetical protein